MLEAEVREVNLKNPKEVEEIKDFLKKFNLDLEEDIDYTLAIFREDNLIATCSKCRNILKAFAIKEEFQGEGLGATIISAMMNELFSQDIFHFFIFTKPCNIEIFSSLGFSLLYRGKEAALLENGINNINTFINKIKRENNIDTTKKRASIVMNCNPFTKGHLYLIEKAARENEELLIFILEEDKSHFPFGVRLALLKEGTKHLKNVKVIPGGEYIISQATFPSYFIKEENKRLEAYTELDGGIFARYFSRELNIVRRYVGEEPYCAVTRQYNSTLKLMMKEYDIELIEVRRLAKEGEFLSASRVRELLIQGKEEEALRLVPEATGAFIMSKEGKELVERLRN